MIAIAWLVPISVGEGGFVSDQGCDVFEGELVEHDPDLSIPFREGRLLWTTSSTGRLVDPLSGTLG